MISFKRLRELKKVSFTKHLITLPYHMMLSVGTGLYAGGIAVRLAGLATAVAVGTTTVLTTTGSLIMGIVGGIVGIVAITAGIFGLASEHSKNNETLKKMIGSDNILGQDHQLASQIANVFLHADQHDEKKLGELLFILHGIEGENLTEKLCDIYNVDYNGSSDIEIENSKKRIISKIIKVNSQSTPQPEQLSPAILAHFTQMEIGYQKKIKAIKIELITLLNKDEIRENGKITFKYNTKETMGFIEKISHLPGDNLKDKLACLYGIDPTSVIKLDDLIEKLKQSTTPTDGVAISKFDNILHLKRILEKMAVDHYMQIIILKSKGLKPENSELNRLTKEFNLLMTFVDGKNYDRKLDTIFKVGATESLTRKFKESALTHPNTKAALEKNSKYIKKLIEAKNDFDKDHFTEFFRPLTYLTDFFYAFSGSLTGFGIATTVAAFLGVGIAASGVGLIVLIAAVASAVIGFAIAYAVRRYTNNYSYQFDKETTATAALLAKSTEKAKELESELQVNVASQNQPLTQDLTNESVLQNDKENEIAALKSQIAELQAQNRYFQASSARPRADSIAQSPNSSFFPQSDQPVTTDESANEKQFSSGEKRAAEEEPKSPPAPSPKHLRSDDGNEEK